MVNCNPETVRTDYDTSDRLYFEPLTAEDVLEILHVEQSNGTLVGVIVQFGGQTPLKLAQALEEAGIPILGTSPDAIDLAEDRERFAALVNKLGLHQPANGIARSRDEAIAVAERIGYPVLMRPSYVLGGRAMEIVDGPAQLDEYIQTAVQVSGDSPGADRPVSARRDRGRCRCDLRRHRCRGRGRAPAYRGSRRPFGRQRLLDPALQPVAPRSSPRSSGRPRRWPARSSVRGLMNIQFAVKDGEVYLIEVNPRASRTVPFVAKAIGAPDRQDRRARDGGREAGRPADDRPRHRLYRGQGSGVPVQRASPASIRCSRPEMKSTGEVMGIDRDFATAFAKSQLGAGDDPADDGHGVRLASRTATSRVILPGVRAAGRARLHDRRDRRHRATIWQSRASRSRRVNKVAQGRPHIVDRIKDGGVDLIFNTTEGWQSLKDSAADPRSRRCSRKVPYFTTARRQRRGGAGDRGACAHVP